MDLPKHTKYNVIYADPPWRYGSRQMFPSIKRSTRLEEVYNTMATLDIKTLGVKDITADDCCLLMWCTDSHLKQGIEVMEAWGFKYRTVAFVWVKLTAKGNKCCNYAPYTLKGCEIVLLGMKGKLKNIQKKKNVRQLVEAARTVHSRKPEEVRRRINELFGAESKKIELFARRRVAGWDSWGDQLIEAPSSFLEKSDIPK
jgi:N6-adenosine-specific RNA methylase IME4